MSKNINRNSQISDIKSINDNIKYLFDVRDLLISMFTITEDEIYRNRYQIISDEIYDMYQILIQLVDEFEGTSKIVKSIGIKADKDSKRVDEGIEDITLMNSDEATKLANSKVKILKDKLKDEGDNELPYELKLRALLAITYSF